MFRLLAGSAAGVPLHHPRALVRVGEALWTDSAHNGARVGGASSCPDGRSDSGTRRVPLPSSADSSPSTPSGGRGTPTTAHISCVRLLSAGTPRWGHGCDMQTHNAPRPGAHPSCGDRPEPLQMEGLCPQGHAPAFGDTSIPAVGIPRRSGPKCGWSCEGHAARPTLGEPLTGLSLLAWRSPSP